MACPHFNIRIVQRSMGQSAVAAAAYQSGERLRSEYELESYRTAIRYFKAHPEYERMKVADVDGKMKLLQSRIEQGEEALPALRQSLQPY